MENHLSANKIRSPLICVSGKFIKIFSGLCCAEPGYYQDGEFGIRIEDVMCSVEANTKVKFDGRVLLQFLIAILNSLPYLYQRPSCK